MGFFIKRGLVIAVASTPFVVFGGMPVEAAFIIGLVVFVSIPAS